MPTCLLGLGSNVGDREENLFAAIADITALPDVQLARHSQWHRSQPVGGPPDQGEFLNAAALIETNTAPLQLLDELKKIEARLGRQPAARWSPRTLDIDVLLHGNSVLQTESLTLPHPRMSFRRFVLEPAAEIAPKMLHPTIGWPVERLLLHLNMASDHAVIVSPSEQQRERLMRSLVDAFGLEPAEPPTFATAEHHWPLSWSTWLALPARPAAKALTAEGRPVLPYAAAAFPKLTILLDAERAPPGDKLQWSIIVRQPGRGPTLRLQTPDPAEIDTEALAAFAAVWPDLGPPNTNRLES